MRLDRKTILFLGSSVTEGYASGGVSFVDLLKDKYHLTVVKEAVSGTTLVDQETDGNGSYVARMLTMPKEIEADAFVCQLSTNDASLGKPLGNVSESRDRNNYDVLTVAGAIEYIISYAIDTWKCPVIFYTGTRYESEQYEQMVDLLYALKEKWGIEILDLWHDEEMNQVSSEDYARYMADPIHPLLAGYQEWWLPKFEKALKQLPESSF